MRIHSAGEWLDGFLDYWCPEQDYRIQVTRLVNLEQLEHVYFVRRRDSRMLFNYLRELGPTEVLRKVRSRSKERRRNEKYISTGYGTVIESPRTGKYSIGQEVIFVAPCHPACAERLVLPEALLAPSTGSKSPTNSNDCVSYLPVRTELTTSDRWWYPIRGWDRLSGVVLSAETVAPVLAAARQTLGEIDWNSAESLPLSTPTAIVERTAESGACSGRHKRRAILFGYGNYARTITLPNLAPYCDVTTVHEIDPLAAPREKNGWITWDTCPHLRPEDTCDICLIAGYHHTHAPLAIAAMRRGAAAVVEKPIVTTEGQLGELGEELRCGRGRLFSCFQKRYHPFNDLIYAELGLAPGDPISYHCIVYEVPLPELHWYRWPSSGSRVLSNGCHWIDHFLHLNPIGEVACYHMAVGSGETVNCSVTLDSGAMFTMVLTECGSSRLGMRDYVELRARNRTVAITDGCEFRAETPQRITHRVRTHRYTAIRAMYAEIGRKIVAGEAGDSADSVDRSSRLILTLEKALQTQQCSVKKAEDQGAQRAAQRGYSTAVRPEIC